LDAPTFNSPSKPFGESPQPLDLSNVATRPFGVVNGSDESVNAGFSKMAIQKFADDPIQARFESTLMEVWRSPEMQAVVERCRKLFFEHPLSKLPEAEATLERSLGQTTRSAADWIVNGDPLRPASVWMQTPPHR